MKTYYHTSNYIFIKYVNYNYLWENYYTQLSIITLISSNNESIFYYIKSVYTTKSYVDNGVQFLLGYTNANVVSNFQCDARYYTKPTSDLFN